MSLRALWDEASSTGVSVMALQWWFPCAIQHKKRANFTKSMGVSLHLGRCLFYRQQAVRGRSKAGQWPH